MALYEHIFMVRQDVTTQQVDALIQHCKGLIEGLGGKVTKVEPWGLKVLAYRIRKNRKAHFVLFNIDTPYAAIEELERQHRLSEDVVRFFTVKVDVLEVGPSAMVQKKDDNTKKDDIFGSDFRRPAYQPRQERGPREGGSNRAPRPPRPQAPIPGSEPQPSV
jgi:small subunit ribosomal protein S6